MNILITGTSSGFGKEMAIALAKAGHTVYAAMRSIQGKNRASANELRDLSERSNGKIIPLEMDVSSDDSVEQAVAIALDKGSGTVDVVINNAGSFLGGLNETFSASQVQQLFNVNLLGPLRVMRAVLPAMRRMGKGTIINVTSSVGRFAMPGSGHYAASKSALESVTESYAYELAPLGIEALILQPGSFDTGIMGKATAPDESERAGGYGVTLNHLENMMPQFMTLIQESYVNQSPTMVADAVVDLLATPYGKRPLRTLVDPSDLGEQAAELNKSIEKVQQQLLDSIHIEHMAHISMNVGK